MQTMIDRGLVEIRRNPIGRPAAFFTEAGLEALRQLLRDRRAMDLERFVHLRQELGL
jgi:DNA-binding MarR family transcriptional regulator